MLSKITATSLLIAMTSAAGMSLRQSAMQRLSAWTDIKCPEGCFFQQVDAETRTCVCPAEPIDSEEPLKASCDSSIEVCDDGLVKTVIVDIGFQYNPNAEKLWFIMGLIMVGYSSIVGSPFDTNYSIYTAWTYNFFWMFTTWGVSLLLLTQKWLFKSEGGFADKWFHKWVNLGAINYFLVYWIIDFMILSGTLDFTDPTGAGNGSWYLKFLGLFVMQVATTLTTMLQKGSLNFDWDLASAEPAEFQESDYVPEPESELEVPEDSAEPTVKKVDTTTPLTEEEISNYWGF